MSLTTLEHTGGGVGTAVVVVMRVVVVTGVVAVVVFVVVIGGRVVQTPARQLLQILPPFMESQRH